MQSEQERDRGKARHRRVSLSWSNQPALAAPAPASDRPSIGREACTESPAQRSREVLRPRTARSVRLQLTIVPRDKTPAPPHHSQPASMPHRQADSPSVRSEEHTSELQSLMRTSYAVFCLKN